MLGHCDKNLGKTLSGQLKIEIVAVYESDENSRMCPGMKETVNVWDSNGEKVKYQKRLVLSNLKELYAAWKTTNPEKKIGFSTFAALRPKWCVLAGASGTHSVCVCKYHQNPKLMFEACLKSELNDLMKLCVCSIDSENCMMGHWKERPGHQRLIDHLNECEELADTEDITYQQWISTDRTALMSVTKPKLEFFENLAMQVVKLTQHSFTAKSQSAYMKTLKSSMKPV